LRQKDSKVRANGWPMKGLKPPKVAAREAYKEGGPVGRIIGK
jgi:hypothetical protein